MDVASWMRWTTYSSVSFMFAPHDVLLLSLCVGLCLDVLFFFMLFQDIWSCSVNGLYYCKSYSKNVMVIIMFYCMQSKSFSGHRDDAMLVVMNNVFGEFNNKGNWRMILLQCTWLDMNWTRLYMFYIKWPCKSAANRGDSFCSNFFNKTFTLSA